MFYEEFTILMEFDVVIIGAGPGGLHCGKLLSEGGARVLILEKNELIGKKVCAGGVTWNGFMDRIPHEIIEQSFQSQKIVTTYQSLKISRPHPIVATVNRQNLGKYMAAAAQKSGARLAPGAYVETITDSKVHYRYQGNRYEAGYSYLAGADGSMSKVRSHLGLKTNFYGIGINYNYSGNYPEMVWNFNPELFGCGYSWIFPHRTNSSIGVYAGNSKMTPALLDSNLKRWLSGLGIELKNSKIEAEKICIDFHGWKFGNKFLIGDAGGFTSPLTGEGIYPAIVSAEAVSHSILYRQEAHPDLDKVINKHKKHKMMVQLAGTSNLLATFLSELTAFMLRSGVISFEKFEMV
ncbi:MAG: NAD(P)/FAD-dependent oxidoreductase [Eudoraea sp.]|nr:NAD(P)/FAD-dependent oxidoreductase [Eudoraea sp.]